MEIIQVNKQRCLKLFVCEAYQRLADVELLEDDPTGQILGTL